MTAFDVLILIYIGLFCVGIGVGALALYLMGREEKKSHEKL